MDSDILNRVILFQSQRRLKNLTSKVLTILEARVIYIKQLEGVLIKMGVGDYENSPIDYQRDRKNILDFLNNELREIQETERIIN